MSEDKNNKYIAWFIENWLVVLVVLSFSLIFGLMLVNITNHKNEVKNVSTQNAECIYLEASSLGEGQHFMICGGQIVLKRFVKEDNVKTTTREKLEKVVPTEPAQ